MSRRKTRKKFSNRNSSRRTSSIKRSSKRSRKRSRKSSRRTRLSRRMRGGADIQEGELLADAKRPPLSFGATGEPGLPPALLRLALATMMNPRLAEYAPATDLPGDVVGKVGEAVQDALDARCHKGPNQLADPNRERYRDGYMLHDTALSTNNYQNYKRQYEFLLDDMSSRCNPQMAFILEKFLKEFFVMFIGQTNLEKIEKGETTLLKIFYETPYECPYIRTAAQKRTTMPIWSIKLCVEMIVGYVGMQGDWYDKWMNQLKSYHAAARDLAHRIDRHLHRVERAAG